MSRYEELHQTTLHMTLEESKIVEASGEQLVDLAAKRAKVAQRWCVSKNCGMTSEVLPVESEQQDVIFSCIKACPSPGAVLEAAQGMSDDLRRITA